MEADVNNTLEEFNTINENLKRTVEKEYAILFLHTTIINRESTKLTYNTYRNPAIPSTIIYNASCKPIEHKVSVSNYLYDRENTYSIVQVNKKIKEINIAEKCNKKMFTNSNKIKQKINR